jgi:hypothetical protein
MFLLAPTPIKPNKSGHEQRDLTADDLPGLERKIAAAQRDGWKLRSRGHSSDGIHSATMIRSEAVKA